MQPRHSGGLGVVLSDPDAECCECEARKGLSICSKCGQILCASHRIEHNSKESDRTRDLRVAARSILRKPDESI